MSQFWTSDVQNQKRVGSENRGFTLIELLVVIAIIGLLSSVVFASLNSARAKARDARRQADIGQFKKALELYYDDNGQYPPSGGALSPNSGWSTSNDASWTTLQTALASYIPRLPLDPKQSASGWAGSGGIYTYSYYSLNHGCDRQWYMVVYRPEGSTFTSPGITACNNTNFINYSGTVTQGERAR